MTRVTYRERLTIPWWWLILGLGFVASVGVVLIFSMDLVPGIAATLLTLVAVAIFLGTYSATPLEVEDGVLTAGRNKLEREYISDVEPLSGDEARQALGSGVDPRAFLFTRPFIRDAVKITLDDPADPHPYWLVSTRRPQELADAIRGA